LSMLRVDIRTLSVNQQNAAAARMAPLQGQGAKLFLIMLYVN
jgi:hypothetical protein